VGRLSRLRVRPGDIEATNTPADTQVPSYDALSGLFKWVAAGGVYDPFGRRHFHDMMGTTWSTMHTGSGSIPINQIALLRLSTGTAADSHAIITCIYYIDTSKNPVFEWSIRTAASVSPCLMSLTVHAGLVRFASRTSVARRMAFHIDDGELYATTADGSGYTETDLGPVTTGTSYQLRAKLTSGKVEFYKNGVLVATHTTNLPSGAIDYVQSGIYNKDQVVDKQLNLIQIVGFVDY